MRRLAALLLGGAVPLVIEGLLALGGVVPLAREDPFVGFAGTTPLFLGRKDGDGVVYRLNPAKERWFNGGQSFRMPKPPGTYRIVAVGGSTIYGHPWRNETSIPASLAALLGDLDTSRTYEWINAGGISYASYRDRRLVEDTAAYDPDLYVVYSGHNEFLESRTFAAIIAEPPWRRRVRGVLHRSRIYTLLYRLIEAHRPAGTPGGRTLLADEIRTPLEEVGGPALYHRDDAFRAGVVRQFRLNIEAIARFGRERGIPVVLCTVPSDLTVSPFKSEHRAGLAAAQRERWETLFGAAEEAYRAGRLEEALDLLGRAGAIDDRYATLHFARGEVLRALGRFGEARAAYLRAKEEDVIPLRALEAFNDAVRDVARREGATLADVAARFAELSPGGIPGGGLFADHVHPTLEGQQLAAEFIAAAAVAAGIVPVAPARWADGREAAVRRLAGRLARVDPRYRALGLFHVGRLFQWAGKPDEARRALLAAREMVRDAWEIPRLLGSIALGAGDADGAIAFLAEAERIEPGHWEVALDLALAHVARGEGREALRVIEAVPLPERERTEFLIARGEAETLTGDLATAARHLREAAEQAPAYPRIHLSLARALLRAGDAEGARASLRRGLDLEGETWSEERFTRFAAESAAAGPEP